MDVVTIQSGLGLRWDLRGIYRWPYRLHDLSIHVEALLVMAPRVSGVRLGSGLGLRGSASVHLRCLPRRGGREVIEREKGGGIQEMEESSERETREWGKDWGRGRVTGRRTAVLVQGSSIWPRNLS